MVPDIKGTHSLGVKELLSIRECENIILVLLFRPHPERSMDNYVLKAIQVVAIQIDLILMVEIYDVPTKFAC